MHKVFEGTTINISKYKKVTYKKNDIVFNESDLVNYIGLVESGMISIKTYTYDENEYEINNISANGIFGEYIIFSKNPHFLGTGIAVKETIVRYISKNDLQKLLTNETFFNNYFSLISIITINIQNKVKILSQKEIKDKVLFLLIHNLKHNNSDTLYITSKNNLAQYFNVTRPSLSRTLISMQDEGLITFDKHYIKINKKAISRI